MVDKHLLPRTSDRMAFLYIEHAKLKQHDQGLVLENKNGLFQIPIGTVMCLLLGPGTSITHDAISLISQAGCTCISIGMNAFRVYAYGEPLNHSSRFIEQQAKYFANKRLHLQVARQMYQKRFPTEDFTGLSVAKMRGKEGSRMRQIYQAYADKYDVHWNGRKYDYDDYFANDSINQALTSANQILYAICECVIHALGFSSALGFIHVGLTKSFVYDISDLYKASLTIPVSFKVISQSGNYFYKSLRTELQKEIINQNLLDQITKDLLGLFEISQLDILPVLYLWDTSGRLYKSGVNYVC